MRILVTGAAGFIGRHVCKTLSAVGHQVVGVDNFVNSKRVEGVIELDVAKDSIGPLAVGCDVVIHLAAMGSIPKCNAYPDNCFSHNIVGFSRVVEAAIKKHVPMVLYASSSSVYGSKGMYPETKELNEKIAETLNRYSKDTKLIGMRFFNVFGPGQRADIEHAAFVPKVIQNMLLGEEIPLYNYGLNKRDFTPVGVVCDVISKVIFYSRDSVPAVFDIGMGDPMACTDIISEIYDLMPQRPHVTLVTMPPRSGELEYSEADTEFIESIGVRLDRERMRETLKQCIQEAI